MPFTTTLVISDDAVRNCLCGAFEGASSYWIGAFDFGSADGSPCPKLAPGSTEVGLPRYMIAPFCPGHWVEVIPSDAWDGGDDPDMSKAKRLDRDRIVGGLSIMATTYPKHYADLCGRNDDATTADLLLQLCLFGEEVYA